MILVAYPFEIEIREVHATTLPPGRWWYLVPPGLSPRPLILTSDPERFKMELAGEAARRGMPLLP